MALFCQILFFSSAAPCGDFAVTPGKDCLLFSSLDESQPRMVCGISEHRVFEALKAPLLPPLGNSVRHLACGVEHCLALLRCGEVMAWGQGPQLGLGVAPDGDPRGPFVMEPQPVPGVRDAIAISAGAYHSAVVVIGGSNTRSEERDGSYDSAATHLTASTRSNNMDCMLTSSTDQNDLVRLKVGQEGGG